MVEKEKHNAAMPTLNESSPTVEQFLGSVLHQLPAYRHSSISFVSLVHEGYETILRASLRLDAEPATTLKAEISISDLRAAHLPLPDVVKGLRDLLSKLVSGEAVLIGSHMLKLHPDTPHSISSYYEKAPQIDGRLPRYRERLVLSGASPWILINPRQPGLDRLLQSHAYDSLADLLREYGLEGIGHSDRTTFEIVAGPVARIEATSQIQGDRAEISVLLAPDLPMEGFQLTVRNADRREDSRRRTFGRDEFTWMPLPDCCRGVISFSVPKGTILESRALFAGHVQDSAHLADPSNLPNQRRRVVELNDQDLKKTTLSLTNIKERDDKLRDDFESSVAVLFYLLGFETVRIGGNRKTTDGPDIYAKAPSGELLVVECTSGAFDEEKLGKLMTRTKLARERFGAFSPQPCITKVTPTIVTPRTATELGHLLSQAEKDGVLVLYHPDLLDAIEQTRFFPDADVMLSRWRNSAMLRFLSNPRWD